MQILFMTTPQAQAAFDAASGEAYASLLANSLDDAMTRTDRLIARSHEISSEGWGLWGGLTGRDASVDGDGNAAQTKSDGYGFDVGIDFRGPGNRWALGAVVGYADGALNVDARRSTANYDGWHIGAYGRYGTGNSGLSATGAISYGDIEANVRRTIAFGTLSRDARATVDMQTIALEGELRYGLPAGGDWAFGPMASFFYADSDLGRFAETVPTVST
jgi:outer membrane autotransporter protein